MVHVTEIKNLPYSVEHVKEITKSCKTCAENQPKFYPPNTSKVIKSMQPYESIALDFKGLLLSKTPNKYMLTIIDEYSWFPFTIPYPNLSYAMVIQALCSVFAIFGLLMYIHSDRGASFISKCVQWFLQE